MPMLSQDEFVNIATNVATANLSHSSVSQVLSEPTVDSEGHEALRITIVVTPESSAAIKGDDVLDTLVQIRKNLQTAGEPRCPIVEFATPQELAETEGGDS
jgi:hypothetical protein